MALPATVRDLLARKVGVPVTARTSPVGVAVAPGNRVLKQDPTRIFFLVVNTGAVPVFLQPAVGTAPQGGSNGVRLEANGGAATTWWEEDGEVTAYEWNGVASAAGGVVFVMEVVIDRGGETL